MLAKKIFTVMLAVAFSLGAAGLGFSAQGRGEAPVKLKPADTKVCGNINCCGNQAAVKKDAAEPKKSDEEIRQQFGGG